MAEDTVGERATVDPAEGAEGAEGADGAGDADAAGAEGAGGAAVVVEGAGAEVADGAVDPQPRTKAAARYARRRDTGVRIRRLSRLNRQ